MKEWFLKLSSSKKLALAALILGVAALIIGNPNDNHKIYVNAKEMSLSTIKDQDKIDVLTLADLIIKENSDFILVDLRNEKEFQEYSIPTAINVPFESVLESGLLKNQKILVYGNDDITSAQAWFVLKSSNYKNVYILKGGLDTWKNEILFPKLSANASPEQVSAFEKVKQISLHFGGTPQIISGDQTTSTAVQTQTPVVPKLQAPSGIPASGTKKKKEGC